MNYKIANRVLVVGFLIALSVIFLFAFYAKKRESALKTRMCNKWILGYTQDDNWTRQAIICDSIQMISTTEAYVFIDGVKSHIFADKLYPMYEPCDDIK